MRKQQKKNFRILDLTKEHIRKNIKEYLAVAIVLLIGIIIGVIFINNVDESQKTQITDYLGNFTNSLNTDYEIDTKALLKNSIISNLLLAISLWFIGSTVIGIPIVYVIIGVRGFCLGYTISSIMITYSMWKGILFIICSLLLQNIIFIPCILALAVSGIKLYKSIIKDKRRENVKIQILRHTIFSAFIAVLMIGASFVEVYGSSNIVSICIKAFVQ